ncbi:hypothetical protein L249_4874 [Ophiocordyceps polyrhachis-furcata BCC 54312]|uniref:Dolichyldiphosphatase n=1 Tax=Ophiocordyceps polyrhachis-furcata BCC 54312 TaxID=1330021 RepID=A0A367L2I0_9HYPO|nr:hypothetical protein L249_4874 [Ophiocordyceps polyrhachis-furcata BCC 54312]
MDPPPLASLSLTHVYYDPDDRLSLLCAYLALIPQALCIVYATLFFSTREVEIALLFAGQVGCEALNLALKRLFKEDRPEARLRGKGYGMPSSHAQFLAFWSLSLALFLLVRHRPRPSPPSSSSSSSSTATSPQPQSQPHNCRWPLPHRALVSAAALALSALTAWSRVYLGYHSPRQVLAGSVAGFLSAAVWFRLTAWLRRSGRLAWALDLRPARALRLRDLVVYEDLCQAGWEKWERERRRRTTTTGFEGFMTLLPSSFTKLRQLSHSSQFE